MLKDGKLCTEGEQDREDVSSPVPAENSAVAVQKVGEIKYDVLLCPDVLQRTTGCNIHVRLLEQHQIQ